MPSVTTQATPYVTSPYLTVAEFKTAPTAVEIANLVAGGNQQAQDAELANVILRASGYANRICEQIVSATVDTEVFRSRVARDGTITVHPKYWPILEVRAFSYGPNTATSTWVALSDLSGLFLDTAEFVVGSPTGLSTLSSVGPLQLGTGVATRKVYGSYTYVNGWANTTLTNSPSQGGTSINVASSAGVYANVTSLTIYDGASTETVLVSAVNGNTLTVPALQFAHSAGVSVSALPPEFKEAVILLAAALIKSRGSEAIVMDNLAGFARVAGVDGAAQADVQMARDILQAFRRRR